VGDQYKPAELARGDIEAVAEGPPWTVDAWGLGCLMQEAFSGKLLESPEQLRDLSCVPKEISSEYQKLLSTNPARRLNPNKVRAATPYNTVCSYTPEDIAERIMHWTVLYYPCLRECDACEIHHDSLAT
jgi:hypothetical protein